MKYLRKLQLLFLFTILFICGIAQATEPQDNGGHNKTIAGAPWTSFNDAVLNELIDRALDENFSIRAALARIEQAEAQALAARSQLHPKVYGEGKYALSGLGPSSAFSSLSMPNPPDYTQSFTAQIVAQYNIDITGRYVKARQAAQKEVSASTEDVQAQAATIASLVTQAYYDVVVAQMRVKLIEEQIANYENLLKLIMAQFNVGASSALEVLQQRAQLEGKKAQLPLAQTIVESGKLQLASLVGESVESLPEIRATLPDVASVTTVPAEQTLAKKLPDALPSLRAQQIRIEALEDREVSAKRALMPSLGVFGNVGYQWSKMDGRDASNGEVWALGATLTVPIYMGGANHASLKQARAATLSAKYSYENAQRQSVTSVLVAQETERAQRKYLAALEAQNQATEQTVKEATKRYVAGLSTYLNVLNANDALQLSQLNLLQAKRNLLNARIALLEAMGGDWTRKLVLDQVE